MSNLVKTDYVVLQSNYATCLKYYTTIQNNFRFVAGSQANEKLINDLTQDFITNKVLMDGGLLESFHKNVSQAMKEGRVRPSFRAFLMHAVHDSWVEHRRAMDYQSFLNDRLEGNLIDLAEHYKAEMANNSETLYAYSILNRTLHIVRKYCRDKGLEKQWIVFDELVLGEIDQSRKARSFDELREKFYPDSKTGHEIETAISSVKRMIGTHLRTIFVKESDFSGDQTEIFDRWLSDLRSSNSFIHDAILAAVHVPPKSYSHSEQDSMDSISERFVNPKDVEKDLCFAIYLRKIHPIMEWSEWKNPDDLLRFIPSISVFQSGQSDFGTRPLTLEMLMTPSSMERKELERFKIEQILKRVKDLAKLIVNQTESDVERQLFQVIYSLIIAIGRVNFRCNISSLSVREQRKWLIELSVKQSIDVETKEWLKRALEDKEVWSDNLPRYTL